MERRRLPPLPEVRRAYPASVRGGATRSSTRSTSGASPTRTATGSATWQACARACPTCRARRRRALVQPLVPVAAGGRRLRHLGLPLDRPGVRDALGGRAADRRGARARDPHDRRHRPEPRLERAPLVRGGARRAGPARPSADASGSARAAGEHGELPPNDWQSIFGGSAWTRTEDGEWYLHLFAPEQPDLNWERPEVWAEHEEILRFWFDRGVAGVRIDSAALLVKDPELLRGAARQRPR